MFILKIIRRIWKALYMIPLKVLFKLERYEYGYIAKNSIFARPDVCTCPQKIFIYEDTNIYSGSKFIISPDGEDGKFIMKRKSGAAQGLTVITGNHSTSIPLNEFMRDNSFSRNGDVDKDVIVEEDCWIGANVTILSGVVVGRGSILGAGSVLRKSVPPYSIVFGNPARVVAFVFTPDEIVQRERVLYKEHERYGYETLVKNYNKYYLKKLPEIAKFIK